MEISFRVEPGERLEYVNTATIDSGESRDIPRGTAQREVYVFVGGHGVMKTGGRSQEVWPGDTIEAALGATTLTAADHTLVVMIHGVDPE